VHKYVGACRLHEIDQRALEIFVGKLRDKQHVGALTVTLKSNNSPQISVSTAAASVLFMKLWYREIHDRYAINALELRFCLRTSVWEITRV
jgi:hypothetical protein